MTESSHPDAGTPVSAKDLFDNDANPVPVIGGEFLPFASESHMKLMEGKLYQHNQLEAGINSGSIVTMGVSTPGTLVPYITMVVDATAETEWHMYEGGTLNGGVAADTPNRNRTSTRTPQTQFYKNPDSGAYTATLYQARTPGGVNSLTPSGTSDEWIFDTNQNYILEVSSLSNNNDITIDVVFYEETQD